MKKEHLGLLVFGALIFLSGYLLNENLKRENILQKIENRRNDSMEMVDKRIDSIALLKNYVVVPQKINNILYLLSCADEDHYLIQFIDSSTSVVRSLVFAKSELRSQKCRDCGKSTVRGVRKIGSEENSFGIDNRKFIIRSSDSILSIFCKKI